MRIHLISNLFFPDELAGASLYTDMARYFRDAGHDVRVTTTFSYYPAWELRDEDRGQRVREELLEGIPVKRVWMHVPKTPTGKGRLLSDVTFLLSLLRRGRFNGWTPDVVITALPMLSQCLVQRFQYLFLRVPRLIIVQDFAVDAALELGILKLPGAAGLLRAVQRWALRSAQTVTTISPQMLDKLRLEIGETRRTVMIPNWIHQSLQSEIDRQQNDCPARREHVLFYSGNLGVKQGLPDFLTQFAAAGAADSGWQLEICGGGAERQRLARYAETHPWIQLGNVLDENQYVSRLLTTSLCLVTQKPGTGANFLPSKLLPALATGTPVLAVCEKSSPLANEVITGQFGIVVPPDRADLLREALGELAGSQDLLNGFSRCARERAKIYSRETVLDRFQSEIVSLVTSR